MSRWCCRSPPAASRRGPAAARHGATRPADPPRQCLTPGPGRCGSWDLPGASGQIPAHSHGAAGPPAGWPPRSSPAKSKAIRPAGELGLDVASHPTRNPPVVHIIHMPDPDTTGELRPDLCDLRRRSRAPAVAASLLVDPSRLAGRTGGWHEGVNSAIRPPLPVAGRPAGYVPSEVWSGGRTPRGNGRTEGELARRRRCGLGRPPRVPRSPLSPLLRGR